MKSRQRRKLRRFVARQQERALRAEKELAGTTFKVNEDDVTPEQTYEKALEELDLQEPRDGTEDGSFPGPGYIDPDAYPDARIDAALATAPVAPPRGSDYTDNEGDDEFVIEKQLPNSSEAPKDV